MFWARSFVSHVVELFGGARGDGREPPPQQRGRPGYSDVVVLPQSEKRTGRIPTGDMNFCVWQCVCSSVVPLCEWVSLFPLLCLCTPLPASQPASLCWGTSVPYSQVFHSTFFPPTVHLRPKESGKATPSVDSKQPQQSSSGPSSAIVVYGLFLDFVKMCIPSTAASLGSLSHTTCYRPNPGIFRSVGGGGAAGIFHQFHLPALLVVVVVVVLLFLRSFSLWARAPSTLAPLSVSLARCRSCVVCTL